MIFLGRVNSDRATVGLYQVRISQFPCLRIEDGKIFGEGIEVILKPRPTNNQTELSAIAT